MEKLEIKESSPYVKALSKILASHFKSYRWQITAGMNNSILYYIPKDYNFKFTNVKFANLITDAEWDAPRTNLKLTYVTHMVFQESKLIMTIDVLPGRKKEI